MSSRTLKVTHDTSTNTYVPLCDIGDSGDDKSVLVLLQTYGAGFGNCIGCKRCIRPTQRTRWLLTPMARDQLTSGPGG
jgi:hypothetical protein